MLRKNEVKKFCLFLSQKICSVANSKLVSKSTDNGMINELIAQICFDRVDVVIECVYTAMTFHVGMRVGLKAHERYESRSSRVRNEFSVCEFF